MEILKNIVARDVIELEIINDVISKIYVKNKNLIESKEKVAVERKDYDYDADECRKSNFYFGVDLFDSKLYEELAPPKTPSPTRGNNMAKKSPPPSTSTPLKKTTRQSQKDLHDVSKLQIPKTPSPSNSKNINSDVSRLQIPKTPSPSNSKNINSAVAKLQIPKRLHRQILKILTPVLMKHRYR